jgi:OOP family OmpA-OmpF porin
VSADRLSAKGLGKAGPVASNDTKDGRAQNRRVELVPAK